MKTYYLFNEGRLSRKDNTLKFVSVGEDGKEGPAKYIPVEDVDNLYVFGSLDINSALVNFLGKNRVSLHFFDYYEHYTGSFMPKEYLLAGKVQIAQTRHYLSKSKRLVIAKKLLEGAAANMIKNLRYYTNRDKDCSAQIERIETLADVLKERGTEGLKERWTEGLNDLVNQSVNPSTHQSFISSIPQLMGIEGNIRMAYYEAFDKIISDFEMGNREKQPPSNEVNALISFANMVCYTLCLDQLYHTQLNPTISFLHEPGYRRYSLALDLAEVFKPILVDRLIFGLLNKKQIQAKDFDKKLNGCFLKESGRKVFMRAWDERLKETIMHRTLKKKVSYKHLVRLECYKLVKHLLKMEEYRPFKIWW